ncbi:hypothetical protein L1987_13436 [Smallanthus sonchifolius]|uniref:Uncharacterized protein n=1 Tax=Smallanthus sonchifolius TaxID=185202 RepID=A0ACB9JIK8_9ASTR|nr:hypothetical protein L1987_13436 [Smallanthus sonchifolius]
MDAPIQDPVIPDSSREGQTTGPPPESSSKGRSLEDDDANYNPAEDLDPSVTPDTQRLLDELISTPPVGSSSSLTVTIPVSTSAVFPPQQRRSTRSTSALRDESDNYTHMVSTIVDLKARVVSLENLVGDVIKEESSCRQEAAIVTENEDDDPEGAHGGDEQPIASSTPSMYLAGDSNAQGESGGDGDKGEDKKVNENIESETLECLIDLDCVLIDDWESDAEDVEIESEQDDEVVKYATHEGVEFDTSFIDQINQLAREDREEGEIIEEVEKESDSTEKTCDPYVVLSTCVEKKKAWFKTTPQSPTMPIFKSKPLINISDDGIANVIMRKIIKERLAKRFEELKPQEGRRVTFKNKIDPNTRRPLKKLIYKPVKFVKNIPLQLVLIDCLSNLKWWYVGGVTGESDQTL